MSGIEMRGLPAKGAGGYICGVRIISDLAALTHVH
jgi:hypothetical protein